MSLKLIRDDIQAIAPRPKAKAPGAIWDQYVSALTSSSAADLFERYEISTPLRLQHLLATMVCETNLSIVWESGAYTAAGIMRVFGVGHHSSAVTEAEAHQIASLPVNADGSGARCEALFERVYGYKTKIGRSMGNIAEGDGWRHRGLGLNQQTGRASQILAAQKVGCSFDDLQKPINLIHMALCEWKDKNCNLYADRDDPVSIRKLINGGSLSVSISRINGLPEAQAALRKAKGVITLADFQDGLPAPVVAEQDVPKIENVPANPDKPVALMQSTEMQAATGLSIGSGGVGGQAWLDILPRAFDRATSTGRFSLLAFIFALLSDGSFWTAFFATGGVALGIYLMIQRAKRYFYHGV